MGEKWQPSRLRSKRIWPGRRRVASNQPMPDVAQASRASSAVPATAVSPGRDSTGQSVAGPASVEDSDSGEEAPKPANAASA